MQKNVQVELKDSKLTITVDTTKTIGPSKSGKSINIATTGGNIEVTPGLFMGLNVYRKAV
jgi:hypothetical protein